MQLIDMHAGYVRRTICMCHATARARLDAVTVNSKLGPFIKMQHIAYSLVNTN